MFTGIIEEVGALQFMNMTGTSGKIGIYASKVLMDVKTGDSIAVNGVCLTVTDLQKGFFTADVMPETIKRTNLGKLKKGDKVNLERAMPCNGRFGGHIVSGHIDTVGTICGFRKDENAVWVKINCPKENLRLVMEKGSITIDGISLTVAAIDENSFQVSVIPHTAKETTLLSKKVGDEVNLENDIIGKYVQRLVKGERECTENSLTYEMLEKYL